MPTFDPYGKGCWICILVGPGWLGPSVDVLTLGFLLLIFVMARAKLLDKKLQQRLLELISAEAFWCIEWRLNVLASPVL